MTTNQTIDGVPRRAIEWAFERLEICQDQAFQSCECEACEQCGKMPDGCSGTECAKTCQCSTCEHCSNDLAMNELRALLDAPAETFSLDGWGIDHSAGRPVLVHNRCSVIEAEQAYGLLEMIKSAAQPQPQGEPVAFTAVGVLRDDGDGGLAPEWILEGGTSELWAGAILLIADEDQELCAEDGHCELYRVPVEQPAPVAVVLPERKTWDGLSATACNLKGEAWNACLDELKRLNPSL